MSWEIDGRMVGQDFFFEEAFFPIYSVSYLSTQIEVSVCTLF